MVRLGERGVSDIVVIVIMFIFLVLSAALLLGYTSGGISAAEDRQIELKADHLHRALERAEVRSVPALQAAAEQLVLKDPRVESDYLNSWMENTLEFFSPPDYGVEVSLVGENATWGVICPEGVRQGENFTSEGVAMIPRAGGSAASVDVRVRLFRILD